MLFYLISCGIYVGFSAGSYELLAISVAAKKSINIMLKAYWVKAGSCDFVDGKVVLFRNVGKRVFGIKMALKFGVVM